MGMVMILALVVVLIPGAVIDVRSHRIPNLLSVAGVVAGIALQTGFLGIDGLLASLGGMTFALVFGFLLFALGWLGAGDAKLMAAVGAIIGFSRTPEFLFWTVMSGGVMALVALAAHGALVKMLRRFWSTLVVSAVSRRWLPTPQPESEVVEVPYAVAITLGSLVAVVSDRVWLI